MPPRNVFARWLASFETWIDHVFLSEVVKRDQYTNYKARVLATVHLLLIGVIGVSAILSHFLTPENDISLGSVLVLMLTLPYFLKKFGNLVLSGNLLALGFAVMLAPMVFKSGGLYSDNLLWMVMCPLVAMLFANKKWAFIWNFILAGFAFYLYRMDSSIPGDFKSQVVGLSALYYFISYLLLFSVITVIVLLFKLGEELYVKKLRENQDALQMQRKELVLTNQQLRQLSEQLQRSNRDLESFAYAASHDLKEPLRMIGIYTQLIQKRIQTQLTSDTIEMMQFVQQGVSQMQRLLDDVLEYSRVGRREDKQKMIDIEDVLFYIRNTLKLRIAETGASIIEVNTLPPVYGRYSEMVQLFLNLINNAIKFSKKDLPPEIKIASFDRGDFVCFSIHDNGIGIEKEFHDKVFKLFERLHNKHTVEGSGIGLATCKKIVQNQNGEIWLESEPGEGTTFFFTLPKNAEAYQKASQTAAEKLLSSPNLL